MGEKMQEDSRDNAILSRESKFNETNGTGTYLLSDARVVEV